MIPKDWQIGDRIENIFSKKQGSVWRAEVEYCYGRRTRMILIRVGDDSIVLGSQQSLEGFGWRRMQIKSSEEDIQ